MLKHVFYLHSQTCYITALKVIKNKKISSDQVIFLISRNTPLFSNNYQSFHIYPILDNWPFYTQKQLINLKWIFNYKALKIFDNIINNFIQDKFVFYSQNSRHYKYNVFISSKNCVENHFIEDGLDMYSSQNEFNIKYPNPLKARYKLVNNLLSNLQNLKKRIFQKDDAFWSKNNKSFFYALSNLSYNNLSIDKNKIINLQEVEIIVKIPKINSNYPIILPSALEEQNITTNQNIADTYIYFLKKYSIDTINIKWHPAHTLNSKNIISKLISNAGISINYIDDSIPMELFFASENSKLILISNGSSLLIYGVLLGKHKSHVIFPVLHKITNSKTPRSQYWENTFLNLKLPNLIIENEI
jgi:hypothetical protein